MRERSVPPRSRRRRRLGASAAAFVVALTGAAACGSDEDPAPAERDVGELIAEWSEADVELALLEPISVGTNRMLIATPDELDDLLDRVDPRLPGRDRIASVDITDEVLVVGSYGRCTERSRVVATDGGSMLELRVEREEDVLCDWAPLQVDVWSVDRADVAADVRLSGTSAFPTTTTTTTTAGDGSPDGRVPDGDVGELVAEWSEQDIDRDLLDPIAPGGRRMVELVATPDDHAQLVGRLDPALDGRDRVAGVDLDDQLLVVGAYHRCTEWSRVVVSDGGSVLEFVVEREDGIECVWAPLQIDVWAIDRADVADGVRLATE